MERMSADVESESKAVAKNGGRGLLTRLVIGKATGLKLIRAAKGKTRKEQRGLPDRVAVSAGAITKIVIVARLQATIRSLYLAVATPMCSLTSYYLIRAPDTFPKQRGGTTTTRTPLLPLRRIHTHTRLLIFFLFPAFCAWGRSYSGEGEMIIISPVYTYAF